MRKHHLALVLSLLASLAQAPAASALLISDFIEFARFDLALLIPGPSPLDSEAVTIRPGPEAVDTLWFTGVQDDVGYVFEMAFNTSLRTLSYVRRFEHGFGDDAEGLAWAGDDHLLVSRAPDGIDDHSGVYLFDLSLEDPGAAPTFPFLDSTPALRPEGLAIDPDTLGPDPTTLWIVDEGKEKAYEFDLDLSTPDHLTFDGTKFATDVGEIDIDLPEGIAVFGTNELDDTIKDLLLADDGQGEDSERGPSRIVQVTGTSSGTFIEEITTTAFGITDLQGLEYDPQRRFVYLVGDDDQLITVLALPIPEPGPALIFSLQGVAVGFALRRRLRHA
jgi:hypothetical protein